MQAIEHGEPSEKLQIDLYKRLRFVTRSDIGTCPGFY